MATIPPHLIFDPYAPIPERLSKRDRTKLQELREAYQASIKAMVPKQALRSPEEAAALFMPVIGHMQVEALAVVGLNARLHPIEAPVIVSRGDVDGTDAGPRAIMRAVLIMGATSFLMAHNHPAGEPSPSPQDIAVTKRLVAAGRAVDCPLNDHLIITNHGSFYSFRRSEPGIWS
jgi:DNA repair protein RadC